MATAKKLKNPRFGQPTAEFLDIAYKDYLAARVLILQSLLVQGAVLASTAIEKYFKAILAFNGQESHGHLKNAHYNAVTNFDLRLASNLNKEFVELLKKCYKLRYQDNLDSGFNLVIASREFLAELDYTACMIQESFRLQKNDKAVVLGYDQAKIDGDERLLLDNFVLNADAEQILGGAYKQSFISAEPQLVFEIRNCPLLGLLEVTYTALPQASDGKFMRFGFVPQSAPASYQMSFKPMPP